MGHSKYAGLDHVRFNIVDSVGHPHGQGIPGRAFLNCCGFWVTSLGRCGVDRSLHYQTDDQGGPAYRVAEDWVKASL